MVWVWRRHSLPLLVSTFLPKKYCRHSLEEKGYLCHPGIRGVTFMSFSGGASYRRIKMIFIPNTVVQIYVTR